MKKTLSFIVIIICISFSFSFISCNDSKVMGPVEYHDKIIGIYNNTDSLIVEFVKDVYDKESTVADLQNDYNNSLDQVKKNMDELNSIKKLVDDPGLLDAVKGFHEVCDESTKKNFTALLDIFSDRSDWTDEKGHKVDKIMDELYDKIIDKENKVDDTEESFALKYGIVLPEK